MSDQDFKTTFTVDRTPDEAFAAINDVRGWWSGEIVGNTDQLNDEFTYRYKDIHYSKQRITESIPGKRVTWLVVDSHLSFVEDTAEWTGTRITFDISRNGDKTEVGFAHIGLAEHDCFEACSSAWRMYINGALRNLIAAGEAHPSAREKSGLRS